MSSSLLNITAIHLRAESEWSKPSRGLLKSRALEADKRTPLTPGDAESLLKAGFKVVVEKSNTRCFKDGEYERVGCELVPAGSWTSITDAAAADSTLVVGIRAVPTSARMHGRHAYFAHAFKNQRGAQSLLRRLASDGGSLFDLEYFVNEERRRLCSFGWVAGWMAVASAVLSWCQQALAAPGIAIPADLISRVDSATFADHARALLQTAAVFSHRTPRIVIVGKGNVGQGAIACAQELNIEHVVWDRSNTRGRTVPIEEFLTYDILVNAIRLTEPCAPFLTREFLMSHPGRSLSVIVDVGCETGHPYNPLPIYQGNTSFKNPSIRILEHPTPLDVIAIPSLPSLVPETASRRFSADLTPLLLQLKENKFDAWNRCFQSYRDAIANLLPVASLEKTGPLSLSQQRLLPLRGFTRTLTVDYTGSAEDFNSGLAQLVKRHPILRTTFDGSTQSITENAISTHWSAKIADGKLTIEAHGGLLDDESLHRVARELLTSAENGETAANELQSITSIDYAKWQQSRFGSDLSDEADLEHVMIPSWSHRENPVLFWRNRLLGSPPMVQLPTDRSRPSEATYECAVEKSSLEGDIRALGPTYAVILAAWQVLCHRMSGEDDVVIGVIQAALPVNPLGFFENPLPVRCEPAEMTFHALVEHTTTELALVTDASDVPLERICQTLPFQVAFRPGKLTQGNASEYDVTLEVDSDMNLQIVYNKRLYSDKRMSELMAQLKFLLAQCAADSKRSIQLYSLIPPSGAPVLPDITMPLDAGWSGPIVDNFKARAKETPNAVAISYANGDIELSYAELDQACNRLSNYLHDAGIRKDDVIGLYGHRGPAVVVAIMATLQCGAAYCMMDPKYPVERIQQCMEIAQPKAWIQIVEAGVPPAELTAFLEDELNLCCLLSLSQPNTPAFGALLGGSSQTFVAPVSIDLTDMAVITFTSGSTGKPKGVMGLHGSLTHFYPWMAEEFALNSSDRFSMCSGIAHDPLQRDIFTPLFFGATIYIPDAITIVQPGELAAWMRSQEITITCLTPAMGQLLTTGEGITLPKLRAAFFVGDMLIRRDVVRLRSLAPASSIINMYGSTETQRAVGYFTVSVDVDVHQLKQVVHVGKGMKDAQMIVLGCRSNKPVGIGEVGEIYVRSPHIARGYIGLKEQTAAKFLLNSFTGESWDRMYRTGDLGRFDASGNLECAGRADDQVKIRGFRIELGEINAHLSEHPSVKVTVTVCKEIGGEKRIVCYIVPTSDAQHHTVDTAQLSAELTEFLRTRVPQYMVPYAVVVLQTMPLTPNGKIARKALPLPQLVVSDVAMETFTAEQTKMVEVWAQVLGRPATSIALDSNFFSLGGHSLLATQLTLQISKAFDIKLPLNVLFASPTPSALIEAIQPGSKQHRPDEVDLLAKATAELEKIPDGSKLPEKAKTAAAAQCVLLTGATGFLGAFLLRALLVRTQASTIVCHVRAKTPADGLLRITRSMEAHLLWRAEFTERIECVVGDLGQERLGLSEDVWSDLCQRIDAIYHNGALVHWMKPLDAMWPVNVGGTVEVLKLANTTRLKHVHHVSTTSVFDSAERERSAGPAQEDDPLHEWRRMEGTYPQTKWAAEKVIMLARDQRASVATIYRPGYISGDSSCGVWNTDDFLCRLCKGVIQLGSAPDLAPSASLNMAPVDYVADAIVLLSQSPEADGGAYHVTNPNSFSFPLLFHSIRSYGFPLNITPYAEWRELLVANAESNALAPLLAVFHESWAESLSASTGVSVSGARRNLQGQLDCPNASSLLLTYFSYFIRCQFINAPPSETPNDRLGIDWGLIAQGMEMEMISRTGRSTN